MSKHTPGPWDRIENTVFALDESGTCNRFSALIQGGFVSRPMGCDMGEHTSLDEQEANGRLIAAAPDLLAALEGLLSNLSEGDFVSLNRLDVARAAIAKARGQ